MNRDQEITTDLENYLKDLLIPAKSECVSLICAYIPSAISPTIIPQISSRSYYEEYEEKTNNTFQRFIFEGRYERYWSKKLNINVETPSASKIVPNQAIAIPVKSFDFKGLLKQDRR